jgi:hypothetical protein
MNKLKYFYYYYFYCFYQILANNKLIKKKNFSIISVLYSCAFMGLSAEFFYLNINQLLIIFVKEFRVLYNNFDKNFGLVFVSIFVVINSIFFLIKGKKIIHDFDEKIQVTKKDIFILSMIPLLLLIFAIIEAVYIHDKWLLINLK